MSSNLYLLSVIIILPFLGMLFVLAAKNDEKTGGRNVYNVSLFTVIANIVLILRMFSRLDVKSSALQLVERFTWLENPRIDIVLGVDVFSALLLLSIHLAFIIGFIAVRHNRIQQKSMMVFALLFLSQITGFLLAADVFSFYIFFEAMLFPVFMLIGIFGDIRRQGIMYRFFLYNFLGAVVLFLATIILYNYQNGAVEISKVTQLSFNGRTEHFMWASILISFLSRIPIWPFHFWIASVSSSIKNPLVFIIVNLIPLTGIYGLIRFLPQTFPVSAAFYITALEIIGVVTMLFIALIGFINRDTQYKFFSYITVYYIMYMLGLLSKNTLIMLNVGFSFFSYLIIVAGLEFVSSYVRSQQEKLELGTEGLLCPVPRLAFVYSFLVLAAIGLPVSSLFLNNFLIISSLLENSFNLGITVVCALVLSSGALLGDLYRLKDSSAFCPEKGCITDISKPYFFFMTFIIFVLIASFIRPLWFLGR